MADRVAIVRRIDEIGEEMATIRRKVEFLQHERRSIRLLLIRGLRAAGCTYREIAAIVGVTRQRAHQLVTRGSI